jgi:modulator of FtsH protease
MEMNELRFDDALATPNSVRSGALVPNRVLRNTYLLLSMTLVTSAAAAGVAMAFDATALPWWATLAGFFGLLFAVHQLKDRAAGLGAVFALTGFMGYTLGPLLGFYLATPNGAQHVAFASGTAAAAFIGLSAVALTTKRDFGFLGGFLTAGVIVAIVAGIVAIVLEIPALSLAVSAAVVLLMCGFILFETQRIVNGGETNYLLATVGLYVSIYNLFTSLLRLFGFLGAQE